MKALRLVTAAIFAAIGAAGGQHERNDRTVAIYWGDAGIDSHLSIAAKTVTTRIFADVVRLEWHAGIRPGRRQQPDAIVVDTALETDSRFLPGAMAFANMFGANRITILFDRVKRSTTPDNRSTVLGHVLAHEITHILQNIDRHSDWGLMKHHWSRDDYSEMSWRPLPLTAADVELIDAGLRRRALARTNPAADP
jgi:hypothetical protein